MSENEFAKFHLERVEELQKEISRLTQLLSQERDDFGKKETELMQRISALEMKVAEGTVLTFLCKCGERIITSPMRMYEAKIKALEATNKRYRDGLEKIIETRKRTDPCAKLILMGRIAREAIEGTGDE